MNVGRNPYLSYNLRTVRDILGLSQGDIAKELYINRTTYTKWETGVSEPSLSQLSRIIKFFNSCINNQQISYDTLLTKRLDYLSIKQQIAKGGLRYA